MSDTRLLFDIGNSRIKWAYSSKENIESTGSLMVSDLTPSLLAKNFSDKPSPDSIWISNVGSKVALKQLTHWFTKEFDLSAKIIEVAQQCYGVNNQYQTQDTLGVDRWMAAIGARSVADQGHVIIIDAGTCVTIDWLSESNQFQGGAILPGVSLMHDALTARTAGVKSEYSWTSDILGRSTAECVNSGISFALVGGVERIVRQMAAQIGAPVSLLLTGGSAPEIAQRSDLDFRIENNLVLLGVAKASSERA